MAYDNTVPNASHTPSQDQPTMQGNFSQLATSYNTDHIALTSGSNVGFHQQVTIASSIIPSGQTDPASIIYTSAGTASTVVQPFYKNQNSSFMLIPIKAWAFCNTTGILSTQSNNVTSVAHGGAGIYNVIIAANVLNSINYAVIATASRASSNALVCNYTINSATSFQITTIGISPNAMIDPTSLSFIVIQI